MDREKQAVIREVLAIIPARAGSKRIPNKNIRNFGGKPLLVHSILQALASKIINRVIVDTDSPAIAKIAVKHGAEAPWLRPGSLAHDTARVEHSIFHLLKRLAVEENYQPSHVVLLQPTSPLREQSDINDCWELINKTSASCVVTLCPTHPKLYYLSPAKDLVLVNGKENRSNNTQTWRPAYMINGCLVYIFKVKDFLKEKRVFMKKTKAVISPKWRSVDLDTVEEWALAEFIYKNKKQIAKKISQLS